MKKHGMMIRAVLLAAAVSTAAPAGALAAETKAAAEKMKSNLSCHPGRRTLPVM